jgi:hypothetical protein
VIFVDPSNTFTYYSESGIKQEIKEEVNERQGDEYFNLDTIFLIVVNIFK